MTLQHLKGQTFHKRLGEIDNSFKYNVDYLLIEPEVSEKSPVLFSRNRFNGFSWHSRDNGGKRGAGTSTEWVREVLRDANLQQLAEFRILLLTQPRALGNVFNPVSFWLFVDSKEQLRGVIAEVNNTFGDRHSYLCHKQDLSPIAPSDTVSAKKLLYVSPFQPIEGDYKFRFTYTNNHIGIRIDLRHAKGGIVATLDGQLSALSSTGIIKSLLFRPFGAARVLALIFYQALKLKLKGARYRAHSRPTDVEVSK